MQNYRILYGGTLTWGIDMDGVSTSSNKYRSSAISLAPGTHLSIEYEMDSINGTISIFNSSDTRVEGTWWSGSGTKTVTAPNTTSYFRITGSTNSSIIVTDTDNNTVLFKYIDL